MFVVSRTFIAAMIVSVLFAVMAAGGAQADPVADFYKGRKITLLVGYSAGGAYDTRARLLAKFMGRHIPGNPKITVQNMPGAGSKRLAHYLYNVAPKDGTVFGGFNPAMAMQSLFKIPGTEYDGQKFTWLGSMLKTPIICFAWGESGISKLDDLKTREFIVGATGTGSSSYIVPAAMKRFLGMKIKAIPGYKGADRDMATPYIAPPGLPEDRKQALRRAFDATMRDADFLAGAEKMKMVVRPSTGEEIDALLEQIFAAPAHVVDLAAEVLQPKK